MGASLPALCIDDESFSGTVINDLNGYLFKDKKECEDIIEKLLKDRKKLVFLSNSARSSADMHSSKYFALKVLDVYKKAIKTKNNKKSGIVSFLKKVVSWKKQ